MASSQQVIGCTEVQYNQEKNMYVFNLYGVLWHFQNPFEKSAILDEPIK